MQNGTPTREIQRLGGCKAEALVEHYAHLALELLAIAAEQLDSTFERYDLATVTINEKSLVISD